jgi:hypothetical protein
MTIMKKLMLFTVIAIVAAPPADSPAYAQIGDPAAWPAPRGERAKCFMKNRKALNVSHNGYEFRYNPPATKKLVDRLCPPSLKKIEADYSKEPIRR